MFDPLDLMYKDMQIDLFVASLVIDVEQSVANFMRDKLTQEERDLYFDEDMAYDDGYEVFRCWTYSSCPR